MNKVRTISDMQDLMSVLNNLSQTEVIQLEDVQTVEALNCIQNNGIEYSREDFKKWRVYPESNNSLDQQMNEKDRDIQNDGSSYRSRTQLVQQFLRSIGIVTILTLFIGATILCLQFVGIRITFANIESLVISFISGTLVMIVFEYGDFLKSLVK